MKCLVCDKRQAVADYRCQECTDRMEAEETQHKHKWVQTFSTANITYYECEGCGDRQMVAQDG